MKTMKGSSHEGFNRPSTPKPRFRPARVRMAALLGLCLLFFVTAKSQEKECKDCDISSFQSFTTYYIAQPGSFVGFGLEGGNWNKEESRFSYFLGSKIQWFQLDPHAEKFSNSADAVRFAFYIKGQAKIINRLYLELAPQLVNLSSFETSIGIRYTYPLSSVIGIGVEPTFSIIQKEYSLNANIHFAL